MILKEAIFVRGYGDYQGNMEILLVRDVWTFK